MTNFNPIELHPHRDSLSVGWYLLVAALMLGYFGRGLYVHYQASKPAVVVETADDWSEY